jgi:hypothetical protein
MLALKKPIWSKYPYGPARTRPYGRTIRVWSDRASILIRSVRMVGPCKYTHTVRPYAYGPNTRMIWNILISTCMKIFFFFLAVKK